ncbi:hypothetical protein pETSU_022 [Edwardsiella phage pEt-SU]|uniref:Uncharacterized protein n=1 Tax=Edwardsiella phage pEt-SU TaxID=2562142 RepID=A0A4D6DW91_9CAUD|nr:hypothetical protein HOV39_gp022 [Edwardsiella phage pEt-SU]QBZ70603.1 hypothetical protein pETSU_022 [Edwardsiella phage pEt-SU]
MEEQLYEVREQDKRGKEETTLAISGYVASVLDQTANEVLTKAGPVKATEELLRAQLNMIVPTAGHIARCAGVDEQDVIDSLEIVMDKYLKEKLTNHQWSAKGGMVLAELLLNSSYSLSSDIYLSGTEAEIDVVTLDSITGLDGEEIEFTETGGRRFVPSFDSKEDGKYILHYFVKDTEDKVLLKLTASYDHNTKVVKADGFGWERCVIRIDLK